MCRRNEHIRGRAFVHLRQLVAANTEVTAKLGELERRVSGHDEAIRSLVAAIRQLMGSPAPPPRKRIGFRVEEATATYGERAAPKGPFALPGTLWVREKGGRVAPRAGAW